MNTVSLLLTPNAFFQNLTKPSQNWQSKVLSVTALYLSILLMHRRTDVTWRTRCMHILYYTFDTQHNSMKAPYQIWNDESHKIREDIHFPRKNLKRNTSKVSIDQIQKLSCKMFLKISTTCLISVDWGWLWELLFSTRVVCQLIFHIILAFAFSSRSKITQSS